MTQEAIKPIKQAKQNCGDSLASSKRVSEIWTKLKTRIKTETKNMKNHETTPKYVGYGENQLQETKTTESKRISKVDAK